MLLWSFLLFFLCETADSTSTQLPTSPIMNSTIPILINNTVVLVGDTVTLSCFGQIGTAWYHLKQETGQYDLLMKGDPLIFKATVADSGEYMCSDWPNRTYSANTQLTVVEMMSPLQVVATPGYPIIVEGQTLTMHCNASTLPPSVIWSWYRLDDQGHWQKVGSSRDLTLTKAEESGQYHCQAVSDVHSIQQMELSPNHTVYILSLPATVGENLGIAAFTFSLLALIILFAIVFWLGRQRANEPAALQGLTNTHTTAKGFDGPGKAPKGDLPKSEAEGEVYMNFDQAYSDLEPNYMTGDNVYSSLS
ncbi:low affinity immunoglobulin gamma Fc region receptor III-like [Centroberyx affinis]|uniref:low affinity immunoglobulin gamma Fc region receptor III-like n=1 Tax=Centroberyx affinis TaxID=166261 RepID=UPI003A5C22C3